MRGKHYTYLMYLQTLVVVKLKPNKDILKFLDSEILKEREIVESMDQTRVRPPPTEGDIFLVFLDSL